ncbi:MAG TPA: hypothetical protein DCK99_04855 [Blastocatellia bacterium]|jgi:hypothetical protein|nr:hypothetical protein [Blastocatellia bacterium]
MLTGETLMRMKDISELAKNPNLISGIHNYCDRWCERCPFTARCLVYATEEADKDNDPGSRDISNAAFWQKLAAIFQETKEMISAWAEENGVDLSPDALTEVKEQKDRRRGQARNHPLARAAEEYARAVSQWFEKEFPQMEVFSDGAAKSDGRPEFDEENDYIEVIRWYQFFIAAKTIRGLLSRADEDEYLADEDSRDSDGSIKVALIAIDRSLSAWKLMGELGHENSDSIHKMLLDLEKLRLSAESEFPRARDFIRPGFDENLDMLH